MNWVDIVILVVLLLSTFMGLRQGLINSLVPLIGLLIAIPLAGVLTDPIADKIGDENWSHIAAFCIVFVSVFVLVSIAGWFARKMLKMALLGWVDNLGGAVLGFLAAWLICSMMITLVARYGALDADLGDHTGSGLAENVINSKIRSEGIYNAIDGSVLAKTQIDYFPVVLQFLPGEFDSVENFFAED